MDAVGLPQTLSQAFDAVGTGGTVVALGLGPVGAAVEIPINPLVQQEKRLIGSLYGSSNTSVDIPRLLDLYRAGRLALDQLLGARYDLADINDAYRALGAGATGRAVVML